MWNWIGGLRLGFLLLRLGVLRGHDTGQASAKECEQEQTKAELHGEIVVHEVGQGSTMSCHPAARFWPKDLPRCLRFPCGILACRPGILLVADENSKSGAMAKKP